MNFLRKSKWLITLVVLLSTVANQSDLIGQSKFLMPVAGNCEMCKDNIETAAMSTNGVIKAEYFLSTGLLRIEVNDETFRAIDLGNNLSEVGYDNQIDMADQEEYNQLAVCCQYREFDAYDESLYGIWVDHLSEVVDKFETELPVENNQLSPFIIGQIYGQIDKNTTEPLIGATISYLGRELGATTDLNGKFEIGRLSDVTDIVISYVGFSTDTISVDSVNELQHTLGIGELIDEVVISYREGTTTISHIKPIQTHIVTEEELCKAACCSLSESFETSPAIDVSFTDALTGTRQIQMLGLAGKYVQITRELIPDVRSLSVAQGLVLTPGPWISSIQLSKGVGSVVNGFESMTGQINLELRKPEAKERFYLNLYGNQAGRYEGNVFLRQKIGKNLSTAIILHGDERQRRIDHNEDGFLENSLPRGFIGINRWKYQNENGLQAQLGVKYSTLSSIAGEVEFQPDITSNSSNFWGVDRDMDKVEVWTKIGKVFNETKNNSIGLQLGYLDHNVDNMYGTKDYKSTHNSVYANLIYQTNIFTPKNSVKVGLSYLKDDIEEELHQDIFIAISDTYSRLEETPGAFLEYTWQPGEKLTAVAGARLDRHNLYGEIFTPRLHLRWAKSDNTVFRLIGGKGWRTANPLAENPGVFASNRRIDIRGNEESDTPYGLQREQSWNFGGNLTQTLPFTRKATLSLDYYYTVFNNQILADFESNGSGTILIGNQFGSSSGHSAQAQLDVELVKNFDVRVAYRYNENNAYYGEELLVTPYNPFHKAFINLAYETKSRWYVDFTLNWRSEQRIPNTDWLGDEFQLDDMAPSFFLANAQIRKFLTDDFEMYLGCENILNYRQDDPIIDSDNPFSRNFEASYIYAPIFGRNVYAGLRYKLPYN